MATLRAARLSCAWADLDGSNDLVTRRVFGDHVDSLLARVSSDGTLTYYATDRQGGVVGLLDDTGTATTTMTYTGFGEQSLHGTTALADRYGYVGREQETLDGGKLVERQRLFALDVGKYQTEDPIRILAGDYNFTRRAGNGPTNGTDPSGLLLFVPDEQSRQRMEWLLTTPKPAGLGLGKPVYWRYNDGSYGVLPASDEQRQAIHNAAIEWWARPTSNRVYARMLSALSSTNGGLNERFTYDGTTDWIEKACPDSTTLDWLPKFYQTKILQNQSVGWYGEWVYNFDNRTRWRRNNSTSAEQPNAYVRFLGSVGEGGIELIDNGLKPIRVGGDVIRAGQYVINVEILGDDPYVPDWHSDPARKVADAAPGTAITWDQYKDAVVDTAAPVVENWIAGKILQLGGKIYRVVRGGPAASKVANKHVVGDNCFAGGTPILTPNGCQRIEELRVGDLVLSRDQHDPAGNIVPKVVEEVFVRTAAVLEITINDRVICTTTEHPFYVEQVGWRCASELMEGDRLVSHNGERAVVRSIKQRGQVATVYNVRVSEFHTYFVGNEAEWGFSVWAHNAEYVVVQTENGTFQLIRDDGKAILAPDKKTALVIEGKSEHELAEAIRRQEATLFAPSRTRIGKFLEGDDVAEAGAHAKKVGKVTGVVDRPGAEARRAERMKGRPTVQGKDRDEFPPAAIKPDDPSRVSVEPIDPSHNRRSGRRLRDELPPDGTPVEIDP